METIGAPELILILVIVILLFGPGRISKAAGELGSGIRAFREGINGKQEKDRKPNVVAGEVMEVNLEEGRHSHAS